MTCVGVHHEPLRPEVARTHLIIAERTLSRATIGGYFQSRLPSPFSPPTFVPRDFITRPADFNSQIPEEH